MKLWAILVLRSLKMKQNIDILHTDQGSLVLST